MQWHSSLKAYIPAYSILLDKGLSIRKSIKCRRITTQIEVQLRYILSTGKHYHSSIIKSQVYCVSLEPPAELCFTFRVIILLAHLSRRLIGEPIVYQLSVVRPSVRRPSICRPRCSKIFFSETAGPVKAKFYVEPPWVGGTIFCSRHLGHMTKMAATPIYGKNPSKIFFSRTCRPVFTKLGM